MVYPPPPPPRGEFVDHNFLKAYCTGIIPFSRLGGFCANLGSAEIFLPHKKGVLSANGK